MLSRQLARPRHRGLRLQTARRRGGRDHNLSPVSSRGSPLRGLALFSHSMRQRRTSMAPHTLTVACVIAALALPVLAADQPPTPYAGQQSRSIKALSDDDISALQKG